MATAKKITSSRRVKTSEFEIITKSEFMKKLFKLGATSKESVKPSVKYNRIKYNRMSGREQTEYERKMNIKIPCYQIRLPGPVRYFFEVSKTEYNYFNNLCQTK